MRAFRILSDMPRAWDALFDLVALALIGTALLVALRTTNGLTAPGDPDQFRDLAQAQTTRDGHPLSDPYYRDAWGWRNPLLPWILAAGSALTQTEIEPFHVHAGPWLNLLGPIAFYLLAIRVSGRRAALVALALYLFFVLGNERSWAYAGYSPRLFADSFAQGIFFSAALALLSADRRPTPFGSVVAGALIGLAYLAESAPALILAVIACALFARRWRVLLTIGLAALIIASPFLFSIVANHPFRVLNPAPLASSYAPITAMGLPHTLRDNALLIAAGIGGLFVVRSRFLAVWAVTGVAFLLYAVAPTPPQIPAFHFWMYVTAVLALLAGSMVAWLCPRPAGVILLATLLVAWNWPAYITRTDFFLARVGSAARSRDHVKAARYLRTATPSGAVVLGTYGAALLIIGPAGRKTLSPDPVLANPYIEVRSRVEDRNRMLVAIGERDRQTLMTLARAYDVSAVVSVGERECAAAADLLSVAWRSGNVCVSKLGE